MTFVGGPRSGDSIETAGAVVHLGRADGNEVRTPFDRTVSAQHAKVVRLDDGYVLIDLESRNGTYLNRRRVERSPLRSGDTIGLGPGGPELKVEILSGSRAAAAGETVVIPRLDARAAARGQQGALIREITIGEAPVVVGRDAQSAGPASIPLSSAAARPGWPVATARS